MAANTKESTQKVAKAVEDGPIITFLTFVGELWLLLVDVFKRLFRRPIEFKEIVDQMAFIGVSSVPIVAMTTFFSGAVLSLYTTQFLTRYGAGVFVGATVSLSISREIAPVLAGIMVAARCGSAMAAQVATMKVTEQIDALRMLSVHPTNYLIIPRIIASIIMLPVLTLIGVYSGIIGGGIVGNAFGLPYASYIQSIQQYLGTWDFVGGIVKAPFFGLILTLVACQQGLRTKNGAVGVGRATTNAVVISMVLIYVANFILAAILYQ